MRQLERLARGNPLVVIGLAGLAGWLVGSGIFAVPGFGRILPAPRPSANPAAPATLPVSTGASATLATSSATMAGPPTATDPLSAWNV